MNPLRRLLGSSALLALLLAVSPQAFAADRTLVFGVAPGPYGDLIKQAIQPGLEKRGYKVEIREFSDYVQPNIALANGALDANLFQHRPYLEKFSADKGLKLSPLITVPTAGLGLYSHKLKSIDALKKGDVVTLANDPTNLARALRFLARLDLLTFRKDIDPATASEKDIEGNPKGLVFKPLEAAQLPRTLDSAAASVVNGNFAIAAGLQLSSALRLEELDENLKNLIAVRTEDLSKPFVKDIREVVESDAFLAVVNDPKRVFHAFQRPEWVRSRLATRLAAKP
ncbi:MAG: MetQ/NlpA family ABC transporter substrate-binding protein [Candidatus Dactylopiibacterium sp.]|nr:MetQ/NlpA family ABC transporter substrate-binding protein [Candidatus Dactylopiibacterium sp.]